VFDLRFDFVGDFTQTAVRYEIEGEHAKRHFTVRYFQGPKLMGMLLCNQPPEAVENAKVEVTLAHKH